MEKGKTDRADHAESVWGQHMNLTPKVSCKYGAPMGRSNWDDNTGTYAGKMYLQHIRLDAGGYDPGGAYWGVGRRLYGYAAVDDSVNGFVRAYDRKDAIERVRRIYPKAAFFGERKQEQR